MSAEEKKKKRLESRKRKMEAYIAVAELNDTEKNKKRKKEGLTNIKSYIFIEGGGHFS